MSIEKQGTIERFAQSTNGKPKVLIEGAWYFLGKTDMSSAVVGDSITFEANAFGKDGNLWGINKWGKVPRGTVMTAGMAANASVVTTTQSPQQFGTALPTYAQMRPAVSD